jgi:hypothetical protein
MAAFHRKAKPNMPDEPPEPPRPAKPPERDQHEEPLAGEAELPAPVESEVQDEEDQGQDIPSPKPAGQDAVVRRSTKKD